MALCDTKYPILLVHGMGFRDRKYLNYWGRIPQKLIDNGCEVYYGNQDANGTVESNARMLEKSLDKVLEISGKEKVNIIAHSKGGLDSRYLISTLGRSESIASLSTMNTPHNGSETVDWLFRFPEILIKLTGNITDFFMKILGDSNPESYKVFGQLTTSFAHQFNEENPDNSGVYYQSFGFFMKSMFGDAIMSVPYFAVKNCEGQKNDGLLTEKSVKWTNFRGMFTSSSKRGISHCDEVDLRRRPFSKKKSENKYEISDIADFYVNLVAELKQMNL